MYDKCTIGNRYWSLFLLLVLVFLKDVIDIVKHVPIMLFLVIIASSIAFMIIIIIEKMLNVNEIIRN